jgi:cytochrome c oxidase subunit 1
MIAKQYLITGIFMGIIELVCIYLECNWHGQSNHSRYSIFYLVINLLEWSYGQRYLPCISHHTRYHNGYSCTNGRLSGTFSNLLIPLQMHEIWPGPFMNMISYWLFFISSVL